MRKKEMLLLMISGLICSFLSVMISVPVIAAEKTSVKVIASVTHPQIDYENDYDSSITYSYEYNENGLIQKEKYQQLHYNTFTWQYIYNEKGELIEEIEDASSNDVLTYDYNEDGRVIRETSKNYTAREYGWSGGNCTKYGDTYSYEYKNGVLTRQKESGRWMVDGEVVSGIKQSDYTYDASGNISNTAISFTNGCGDSSTAVSSYTYQNGVVTKAIFNRGEEYNITYKTITVPSEYMGLIKAQQRSVLQGNNMNAPVIMKKLQFCSAGNVIKSADETDSKTPTDPANEKDSEKEAAAKTVLKGKTYTVNTLKYKVTNVDMKGSGTVTLTGTTKKKTKLTKLTVPKTVKINGAAFKVTAIGNKAFNKFTKIKTVTIGDNVKTIGTSAFAGNTKLTKVTVGKGVTKIGKSAFSGDKKLKTITIKSAKLKSVGKNAIKGIYKKAAIKVPKKQLKKYKKLFSAKAGFKKGMAVKK